LVEKLATRVRMLFWYVVLSGKTFLPENGFAIENKSFKRSTQLGL